MSYFGAWNQIWVKFIGSITFDTFSSSESVLLFFLNQDFEKLDFLVPYFFFCRPPKPILRQIYPFFLKSQSALRSTCASVESVHLSTTVPSTLDCEWLLVRLYYNTEGLVPQRALYLQCLVHHRYSLNNK